MSSFRACLLLRMCRLSTSTVPRFPVTRMYLLILLSSLAPSRYSTFPVEQGHVCPCFSLFVVVLPRSPLSPLFLSSSGLSTVYQALYSALLLAHTTLVGFCLLSERPCHWPPTPLYSISSLFSQFSRTKPTPTATFLTSSFRNTRPCFGRNSPAAPFPRFSSLRTRRHDFVLSQLNTSAYLVSAHPTFRAFQYHP